MDTFVTEEREMETVRDLIDRMAARGATPFLSALRPDGC